MDRRTFLKRVSLGAGIVGLSAQFHPANGFRTPDFPESDRNMSTVMHRKVESFDFGWQFFKGDPSGADQRTFNDHEWGEVQLPHDWSIEGPFDRHAPAGSSGAYLPGGIGWYRKRFTLPEEAKGKKVFIQFDGIYHNSEVWLNGHSLGKRAYGYVSFQYDLTPYLNRAGDNVLAVRVDNSDQRNCRWYSGSGIYRHVRLVTTHPLHVAHWGTSVTTPQISRTSVLVHVKTRVLNETAGEQPVMVRTTIQDRDGAGIGTAEGTQLVSGNKTVEFAQQITISRPELWSPEHPVLYSAYTEVLVGNTVVDDNVTPFGLREVVFDPQRGLLLNGQSVKMKGVCIHHDGGPLGAAVPDRALERRLRVLRDMGCNAIRTSHNPPAPELLDLCDRMGFLVLDEAFDKWRAPYYPTFESDWEPDLRSMLQRDRNHPSVILWSVGNEVADQGEPGMLRTLDMLVDFVHKAEPTRPVTLALHPGIGKGVEPEVAAGRIREMARHMDVVSCNYQEQWYEIYREAVPDIVIVGTESFGFFRGEGKNLRGWLPQNPWFDVAKHDYVTGQFLWTGIAYLGESMGWPSKGWPSAPIDICGFRRPRSYFHQSVWSDTPMVHIAVYDNDHNRQKPKPHWDWPGIVSHWTFPDSDERIFRLVTYTNCETVELTINGDSFGEKRVADFPDRMMEWYVPYRPGTITAVGKNRGEEVATHELRTAGEPAGIRLEPDRTELTADGTDLSHVKVTVVDAENVVVPTADHEIRFHADGPAELIAVGSGDLLSGEPFQGNRRKAYLGKCLAILRTTRQPGIIRLRAEADGLKSRGVTIHSM